jgi:hypothetical protein
MKFNLNLSKSIAAQIGLSVGVCFISHGLRKVVEPLLGRLARRLGARDKVDAHKFATQSINLVFHLFSGAWLALTIRREKWLTDFSRVWHQWDQGKDPNSYYILYCCETGYHLQRLLSLFSHARKKDFLEMLLHHVVTVGLMTSSIVAGSLRIGMMVLCVHDLSDALGCVCKLTTATHRKTATVAVFIPTMGLWYYTRLYILPFYVIPAAALCPSDKRYVYPSLGALVTLVGLNGYWFALFCRMLFNAVVAKKVQDIQEDQVEEKKH